MADIKRTDEQLLNKLSTPPTFQRDIVCFDFVTIYMCIVRIVTHILYYSVGHIYSRHPLHYSLAKEKDFEHKSCKTAYFESPRYVSSTKRFQHELGTNFCSQVLWNTFYEREANITKLYSSRPESCKSFILIDYFGQITKE
uniref:Uncharacterized protein n=1 Tax=Glossina austeni TaxID=7395 RepID=A0A1A9UM97_GLOAU